MINNDILSIIRHLKASRARPREPPRGSLYGYDSYDLHSLNDSSNPYGSYESYDSYDSCESHDS